MNNRDYKQFAAGEHYHLYNRGNGKMDIFRDADDYRFLLSRLEEYLLPPDRPMVPIGRVRDQRRKSFPPGSFTLVAYCLMPNHFHFLIRQNSEASLGTLMLNLWSGYSKYFNKRYSRVGSLFQDQFKAIHVHEDTYLKWLSAYIHQNPTVARLVQRPEDYPFSSYRKYLGDSDALCDADIVLSQFRDAGDYRSFVSESRQAIQERKDVQRLLIDT